MKVTELAIYPVKSTRQIVLSQARTIATGFAHDRQWMLADEKGCFISQREHPRLVKVLAEPVAEGLLLQTDTQADILVPTPQHNQISTVTVWKTPCSAADAGNEAAQWFSDFLQMKCRLYYQKAHHIRQVDQRFAKASDRTGFADGFPFLLTSEGSLEDLNCRLEVPVPMKRFRPNIVVDHPEPFAEDNWKVLQIGKVTFRVAKPCSRCVMTTVDTNTGEKSGKDPLMTLATYRRTERGVIFGQNLVHNGEDIIRVGDEVTILE